MIKYCRDPCYSGTAKAVRLVCMNACTVPAETSVKKIEDTFKDYTNRDDIAIILINQHIANMIRHMIDNYIQASLMPSGVTAS